jgi:hypothetical protein
LVRRLQVLHRRCSYSRLLQHYCSVRLMGGISQSLLMRPGSAMYG